MILVYVNNVCPPKRLLEKTLGAHALKQYLSKFRAYGHKTKG